MKWNALSPELFNLALVSVIRKMSQQQRMEVDENHTLLAHVDEIKIMGDTKQDVASSMYVKFNESMQIYGTNGKLRKTKYMHT